MSSTLSGETKLASEVSYSSYGQRPIHKEVDIARRVLIPLYRSIKRQGGLKNTAIIAIVQQESMDDLEQTFKRPRWKFWKGATRISFTKTLKQWQCRHECWEWEANMVKEKLQQLPKGELKQALGDKYDTFMELITARVDRDTAEQAVGQVGLSMRTNHARDEDQDNTGREAANGKHT
ncbi:hypothetical protein F5883DRAFT_655752 [Diaporthe sp. PMI_573]|nr:hypothetical protein F5883DRAFT_655752 [Diaporthaceae sp. PMI_573]